MTTLKIPRTVALAIVSALVTAGVIVSFAESYRALYWWAQGHGVHGAWAIVWPVQIDAFVAVGELALFVALVDAWSRKARVLPWVLVAAGLAVSVSGNVGHLVTSDVFTRLTAAVPSITAYAMLAAGLGLLKRIVAYQVAAAPARRKPGPKPGSTRAPRLVPAPPETTQLTETVVPLPGLDAAPWDRDDTSSFPRLGADGRPVVKAA